MVPGMLLLAVCAPAAGQRRAVDTRFRPLEGLVAQRCHATYSESRVCAAHLSFPGLIGRTRWGLVLEPGGGGAAPMRRH